MAETKTFLVGFDRFISYSWAEYTLEIAAHSIDKKEEQVKQVKQYLSVFIHGTDSTRKTANVLTRLWLDSYPQYDIHRAQCLEYFKETSPAEHLICHWGMSLAIFPLFRDVATQIGKLQNIQGFFRRADIHNRLLEKYSNLNTLPRTVDRIIQTFRDWKVIEIQDDGSIVACPRPMQNPKLQDWLISILVASAPHQRVVLNELYNQAELFPFELQTPLSRIPAMTRIERDGNNLEYLSLK
jgi:hypothetical protein